MGRIINLHKNKDETGMTPRQRGRLAGAGLDALLQMKDGRLKREVHRLQQSDEWEEAFTRLYSELSA